MQFLIRLTVDLSTLPEYANEVSDSCSFDYRLVCKNTCIEKLTVKYNVTFLQYIGALFQSKRLFFELTVQ